MQAVSGSKPAWGATSFNSRPGITFDGNDDNLRVASQPFPSGAAPSEIWGLVSQDAPNATTGTRRVLAYGGVTNNDSRFLARSPGASVNVANSSTGTGGSSISAATSEAGVPFLGRPVARLLIPPTAIQTQIDGITTTVAVPAVSATNATGEVRIGTGTNGAGYWLGVFNTIIVTDGQQSVDQTDALYAYLKARGGIA